MPRAKKGVNFISMRIEITKVTGDLEQQKLFEENSAVMRHAADAEIGNLPQINQRIYSDMAI